MENESEVPIKKITKEKNIYINTQKKIYYTLQRDYINQQGMA